MPNYPNMQPEIIEAVHGYFEDYPEVEADCLLYLSSLIDNWTRTAELSNQAINKLEGMGRCSYCGEPMQYYRYKEPHPELDGCPMEEMTEVYCPNCDMPGQIKMEGWR